MILDGSHFCDQSGVLYCFMVLKYFITICKTVVPIILMITGMMTLGKAIGNPDEIKKVVPSIAKKFVAALAVFLIPTIVNYTINELAENNDNTFADCVANANIDYINSVKDQEEAERKERIQQREDESDEGAKNQADRNAQDDDEEDNANDYHKKKQEERARNQSTSSGSNSSGSSNTDSSVSGGSSATASFGEASSDKRARKTVTINGRTYDSYIQIDFPDVAFDGDNIANAGCSAVSFVQAASGWDRNITVWDGAKLTTSRTFNGIMAALDSKGITYSGPIFYNSNDNDEEKIESVLTQVRNHLSKGKPVIALITGGNNGETKYCVENHFITIFGEDEQGRALLGNCKAGDYGDLEEIVKHYMGGGGKGFLLVG